MESIVTFWYSWGSYVALLVTLLATVGVFYDASRKGTAVLTWKLLAIFATVLVVPSVLVSLVRELQASFYSALIPLAFLGVLAVVLSVLALLFCAAGIGMGSGSRCLNCGKPRDSSWPYCPYCEYDKPRPFQMTQPAYPPSPQTFPPPSEPVPPLPTGETMSLDVARETAPVSSPTPETRILTAAQQKSVPLAYLVVRSGVHQGKTFQLSDNTCIGRKADLNDIVLDDDAVSRQHARIRLEDDKYILTDLGSANGTFMQDLKTGNWKKIQQRQLADGMTFKMGETLLAFMLLKVDKEG